MMDRSRSFQSYANKHLFTVLVASVPGLVVAIVVMIWAGVSAYLIWFIGLVLAIVILISAFSGKADADYQLQTLANLIEGMIEGDYSMRGRQQDNAAFADLLSLINRLAATLNSQERKVQDHQTLLDHVINQLDALIFVVTQNGVISLSNTAFQQAVSSKGEQIHNPTLATLELEQLSDCPRSGLVKLQTKALRGEYIVHRQTFINKDQPHQLYLLTQSHQVLEQKERQSWQNLLRILSHELNNSLAPIATFSRTLLKKINRAKQSSHPVKLDDFQQGIEMICERADSLHQFIQGYGQLAKLPAPQKQPIDWRGSLNRVSKLYDQEIIQVFVSENVEVAQLNVDLAQFEQVLINLVINAIEASQKALPKKQESDKLSKVNAVVEICVSQQEQQLKIEIKDNGAGIANPENLFTPFYTTKQGGQGVGLALSKQIITQHQGFLTLTNRDDVEGAVATILLPLDS